MVTGTADPQSKHVFRVTGWRSAGLWLLSLVVRGWCRTLRLDVSEEARQAAHYDGTPAVLLLWHNRLFAVPALRRSLRPGRRICGLVSASRDGANLARFFDFLGLHTVRGSSSRLGREALHELIAYHGRGYDLAVTPDGPRGPIYDFKAGALLAARRTRSIIILLGVAYSRAWRLRSWDRFYLPLPFSRIRIRCERIDPFAMGHGNEAVARLRERLLAVNGESMPAEAPVGVAPTTG